MLFLNVLLSMNVFAEQVGEDTALPIDKNAGLPNMDCVLEPSEIVDVGSAVVAAISSIRAQF